MSTVQTETQTIHKVFKVPTKVTKDSTPNGKTKSSQGDEEELHVEKYHEMNNNEEDTSSKYEYKMEIVWFNAIGFLILHLGALYGIFLGFTRAKLLTFLWGENNFYFILFESRGYIK